MLNFDPSKYACPCLILILVLIRNYRVRADQRVKKWMEEEQRRQVIDEVQADIDFWAEDMDLVD